MTRSRPRRAPMVVAALAAGVLFVGTAFAAQMHEHVDGDGIASVAAGGRLYDNWMRELAERSPKEVHPLYTADGPLSADPGETWRCVACHDWDYEGIRAHAGGDAKAVVAILTDEAHGYGSMLDDRSLADLGNFVVSGQVDMDEYIDRVSHRARTEPGQASAKFTTVCGRCHGGDGRMMDTIPALGEVARRQPWMTLHKMLNGHPGDNMPALRAFEPEASVAVLAYMQSLPSRDLLVSVARGGRLYDDWTRETRRDAPSAVHPAFPDGAEELYGSWRCVECHGWDYKGGKGAPGLRSMAGADQQAVMRVLTDDTHGYKGVLHYADLVDLANFVSRGQVEMDDYIDPATHKARGDDAASRKYFLSLCANCHGESGIDIRTMPALGRVAASNPWLVLHRTLHGHPGEAMPAWQATMPKPILMDVLATLQSLPTRKRR